MMQIIEKLGLSVLHRMDPEAAHHLALLALRAEFTPKPGPFTSELLKTQIANLHFDNPVGLAAGFDKNAIAIDALGKAGFGFLEVGAATPRPQPGNPKPRLFRLTEDQAVINRFGFNNDGMHSICERLSKRRSTIPVGLNLGANKDSTDRADDYAAVLEHARDHIDFATVNVSSPNTEKLRDLQGKQALGEVLNRAISVRGEVPVFLKIAPDLTTQEIEDIAEIAQETGVSAIIATNTTLDRNGLRSRHADEKGGLSGAPLFDKSTAVLRQLRALTNIPLIGVGGIANADHAYSKIKAGASAVQLYSALAYHGLSLIQKINEGIETHLRQDGFSTLSEAVGCEA